MKHTRQLAVLAALLVAAFAQVDCAGPAKERPRPAAAAPDPELEVKAYQVKAEDWVINVPVSGSLRSRSIVDIKAEVGGRITEMHFEEGDLIRKDQLVASIDPTNYRLAVDQANAALAVVEAGLARARISLEHAQRERERADNLLKSGGITEKDHQAASTAVKEAEAQVKLSEAQCGQARSVISIARKALEDCRIVAPADGRVQRKYLDRGSLVGPGSPIYSIVDNTLLELESPLPAARLSEIRLGQRAVFTTPTFGEKRFTGVVSAINPIVESDNRSVKVAVKVPNAGGELLSGMFTGGFIETGKKQGAAVVPRSAISIETEDSSSGIVYVIDAGVARKRNIRLGGAQQDRVWVSEGLQAGEWVVVEIGPNLKDGSRVRTSPTE